MTDWRISPGSNTAHLWRTWGFCATPHSRSLCHTAIAPTAGLLAATPESIHCKTCASLEAAADQFSAALTQRRAKP